MFRSLATAASGMEAQQTKLDVTANNIANVSTNGFKKGRAEFADLVYQTIRPAGAPTGNGIIAPSPTEIGLGTRLVATTRELGQGELHQTGNPLDLAIEVLGRPGGKPGFCRADWCFALRDHAVQSLAGRGDGFGCRTHGVLRRDRDVSHQARPRRERLGPHDRRPRRLS